MKQIVKDRNDIVFFIKMFPLKMHPNAFEKSKSIVCGKSLKLLEDAFEGKALPPANCPANAVAENVKLGEKLGITGTPAIILPDGAIVPGFKPAAELIRLIEESSKPADK
jgi:thiol:disulfide interchange protein DsbC